MSGRPRPPGDRDERLVAPIEVFADICCPFAYVGLRRLIDRRRDLGRDEPRLRVRAWPLELVNGVPLDPELIGEEVDELRRQVAPDLFGRFEPAAFPPSSLPALAVAVVAYERDLATGEDVSLELRTALFEDGQNLADPRVLASIAARHGLRSPDEHDGRQVVEDWHEGQGRGVVGSPQFFIAGRGLFCPTLDIARVDGRLRISTDVDRLRSFLDEALPR